MKAEQIIRDIRSTIFHSLDHSFINREKKKKIEKNIKNVLGGLYLYNGVYFDPSLPENDKSRNQLLFNITYKNKLTNQQETATFARNEGIQEAFDKQKISVIDCKDILEATNELKKIFAKHEQDFPDLWKQKNWFN